MSAMSLVRTWVLVFAAMSVVSGCSKDSDRPKYREVAGRITAIDLKTGEVTMTYYNEKHRAYQPLTGRLAPDAEILINGETARLEELQVDDRVTVTGFEDKNLGQMLARKVDVRREGPPSSGPATEPAESQPTTATQPTE